MPKEKFRQFMNKLKRELGSPYPTYEAGSQFSELQIDDVLFKLQSDEYGSYIVVDFRDSLVAFKETVFSVLQTPTFGNHENKAWVLKLPMPSSQSEVDTTLFAFRRIFEAINVWRTEFANAIREKRFAVLH